MQYSLSEERYRCLFEQASDLIVIHDMEGTIVNANDSLFGRLGYSREELLGMNWAQVIEPDQLKHIPLRIEELKEGKPIFSKRRCVCKDGSIIEIEANVKKMSDDLVLGVCRDVTWQRSAERELRETELKFRNLSNEIIDSLPGIFVLHDENGRYLRWNKQFERETGYNREEILDLNLDNFFDGASKEAVEKGFRELLSRPDGEILRESEIVVKGGARKSFYFKGKRILYEGRQCIISTGVDISDRKRAEEELKVSEVQQQKKITRAVIKAQEKERTKIGQELHDNVNQILASARIYLTASCEKNRNNKGLLLKESITLIDSAVQELRLLARNEITPQSKLDLQQLIQPLVDNLNEHAVIQTKFDYCMAANPVDADLKLNIYRIVQEQITNILKHSCASSVHIRLNGDDRFICLSVTDDGKGFETAKSRKGIGITNIMNRIESFDGEFSLESSPGNGCKLSVRFPR